MRRLRPVLLTLLASLLLAAAVFRSVALRSDIVDFLPSGRSEATRLMLQELRSGAAANLILVGVEGASVPELARLSRTMTGELARSDLFSFVAAGDTEPDPAAEQLLFTRRYLLSPVVTSDAFTADALHRDFRQLLRQLQSSMAPLAQRYGLADPVGAFVALARIWIGTGEVRSIDGAWFAPDRDRALLLMRTRAGALDLPAQNRADAAIRAAFASANPGTARLLVAGPASIARDVENGIRSDVQLLSTVAVLLVASLLLWRFRSPLVMAAIAVPLVLGLATAALAVQLMFGFVHAIALGFGITMLGVTVDYPVLLIGHRKLGEQAGGTLRRIGGSFNLAVVSASLGLTGMIFAGLPGLVQVGVFSAVGLVTAAGATRWILPPLIVAADLAPVSAGDPTLLRRLERLRAWRLWALLPVSAAILLLVLRPPPLERDLAHLSPVPAASQALDSELRAELGAPDVGQVIIVRGATAELVLQREEALLPRLDRLRQDGVIAGVEMAARYLPSAAMQLERRAALPPTDDLATRVRTAQADLPFRPGSFEAFERDVEAARAESPVRLADFAVPLMAARLQPLLFTRGNAWYGLVVPQGLTNSARLANVVAGLTDATYLDIRSEANAILADSTAKAWRWLSLGGLAVLASLVVGLRDPVRVTRVLAALTASGVVTVAALCLAGQALTLIHIVALQFVAGVGLDYAVFFARRQLDEEERARTLRTLITCNGMTLLTFGLLALCRTPMLRTIGLSVVIGTFSALVFAFLFAGSTRIEAAR